MIRICRSIALLTAILFAHQKVAGQNEPVNQPEKFIFYEIIEADSSSAALLYHNALTWTRENSTKIVSDSLRGLIHAENSITVYKESGVLQKMSGKVSYNFKIEVKDNRYRYHFQDFIFHYYEADRYHKIVPTGKKKNLEEPEAAGWQKLWTKHRDKTNERIQHDIAILKLKIIEKPTTSAIKPEQKKEVKWD